MAEDNEVVILDDLSSGRMENIKKFLKKRIMKLKLSRKEKEKIKENLKEYGIELSDKFEDLRPFDSIVVAVKTGILRILISNI